MGGKLQIKASLFYVTGGAKSEQLIFSQAYQNAYQNKFARLFFFMFSELVDASGTRLALKQGKLRFLYFVTFKIL